MNNDISPTEDECRAARFCACSLSQVEAWAQSVLRVAADLRLVPLSGRVQTQDGAHCWQVHPLAIPESGLIGMRVYLDFDPRMRLCEYREESEEPLPFPAEQLSAVARRMVSWMRHPQCAEDVAQTWRGAAQKAGRVSFHLSCDPDGYAYAISICYRPAQQGEKERGTALELLVMNRLDACWCEEALQEENGTLRPRFRPGTETLFYRPCLLSRVK